MAYREYSINAITDIPAIVEAFATEVGWNVASGPTLRHPNYEGAGPGGLAFTLGTEISGLNHDLSWTCATAPYAAKKAKIRSPILSTVEAPTVGVTQLPTKLFLISMLTPEPYIAIVVEYGYNLYRHLYLGFAQKIGDYRGGEIVSSSNGCIIAGVYQTQAWYDTGTSTNDCISNFLFGWNQSTWTKDNSGGIHVDHADNAEKWRHFRRKLYPNTSNAWLNFFYGDDAVGGFGDSINDSYAHKGKNSIAGANVLTPINLYASQLVTDDVRLIPLGCPAGVRMINIEELEAQTVAEVGGETWYVFAAHRKTSDLYTRGPGVNNWRYPVTESSYYLGYAYRGA